MGTGRRVVDGGRGAAGAGSGGAGSGGAGTGGAGTGGAGTGGAGTGGAGSGGAGTGGAGTSVGSAVEDTPPRQDPRVERTRRLLQDALVLLARDRSLDDISIADIADAATVNRTTFYQHYPDKETLLADALDAEAARSGADLSGIGAAIDDVEHPPEVLRRYLEHVAENAEVYRRALGEHGSPIAMLRLRERLTQIVLEGLRLYAPQPATVGLPIEIVAASVSGSIFGVLCAWLEREPLAPPEQAAGWLWRSLTAPVTAYR